ncbi:MAG: T9SS type A sorting domain-containing protein [Chitinophagaceae bacterium]|nr:T9SS type A sorting domain-containing protein [Chitinophagaceae bacterium]
MKKLLLAAVLLAGQAYGQSTYSGNTKTGFGGTIGNGSLTVTESVNDIVFTLTTGAPFGANDNLVIYFDSKAGGVSNTTTINDASDGGRASVSGNSGSGTSDVTFPSGFTADYGLAWGSFGSALFELTPGGNGSLTFVSFNSNTASRTIPKAELGITGPITFRFVGTYVSNTAYRSNEALVQNLGDGGETGGNFGFNPITFSASNEFPLVPLNVTLKQFGARRQGQSAELNWKVSCTGAYATFELQRSTDGKNFSNVYTEKATAARCNEPFTFADASAGAGKLFYRLKLTSDAGKVTYSSVAMLLPTGAVQGFNMSLVPNVVSGNALLQLSSNQKGNALIRVVAAGGQLLQSQRVNLVAGSQSVALQTATLPAGMYTIVLSDESSLLQQIRFVKQ